MNSSMSKRSSDSASLDDDAAEAVVTAVDATDAAVAPVREGDGVDVAVDTEDGVAGVLCAERVDAAEVEEEDGGQVTAGASRLLQSVAAKRCTHTRKPQGEHTTQGADQGAGRGGDEDSGTRAHLSQHSCKGQHSTATRV